MSDVTIFLLVLILLLIIANWVVSKIRPSASNLKVRFIPHAVALDPLATSESADFTKLTTNSSSELNQALASLSTTNSILKQKVNVLGMKLGEIEQRIFSSPMKPSASPAAPSQTIQNLSSKKQEEILRVILKKLDELDKFKSNTQVDLQGMKEIIQERLSEQKKEEN